MKAILWDFDGTLIHPNESFFFSLKEALALHQYAVDDNSIRRILQATCSWHNPEIIYKDAVNEKWWEQLFSRFEDFYNTHTVAKADREIINIHFRSCILDHTRYTLYQDAIAILNFSRAHGYSNFILSNNYPELPTTIEKLGLSEYFTDYIISSRIGFEKPHIEIFRHALRLAQDPEICYMVGDNPVADIQGAHAAGIKTIFVHPSASAPKEADYVCSTLDKIRKILL